MQQHICLLLGYGACAYSDNWCRAGFRHIDCGICRNGCHSVRTYKIRFISQRSVHFSATLSSLNPSPALSIRSSLLFPIISGLSGVFWHPIAVMAIIIITEKQRLSFHLHVTPPCFVFYYISPFPVKSTAKCNQFVIVCVEHHGVFIVD